MTRGQKIALGIGIVVVLVVVVVVVVAATSRRGPNAGSTVRVRVSRGGSSRPADAVFTPDSEGRYPSDPGWVDEGADVEVS